MELTCSNYYTREADQAYMSVSQFKEFDRCEAATVGAEALLILFAVVSMNKKK